MVLLRGNDSLEEKTVREVPQVEGGEEGRCGQGVEGRAWAEVEGAEEEEGGEKSDERYGRCWWC